MTNKKLRIAVVTNNYTPYSGGVVSSILSFTQELRDNGHELFIITLNFLGKKHQDRPEVIRIKCPIKFMHKKNHIAIPFNPDKDVEKIIKEINPDIIHVQHPVLLGRSGLKAGKKLNIPVIFTYHTQYEQYAHYIPLPKRIVTSITQKLVHSFCASVDHIIAPSVSIKNYLVRQQIQTPIEVIPSGILPIFISQTDVQRSPQKPFRLLTVSRFNKEKNIIFLLDVFAQLDQNNFTFDLIGYGQQLKFLKHYTYSHLRLDPCKVRFIEHPAKKIIAQYYRNSDLFIFASKTETQGLVLAESMASCTPVVALYGPGQKDIIQDGVNGFLVHNKEQMIEKIISISSNTIIYNQLRKKSWEMAREYTPERTTKKLINAYYHSLNMVHTNSRQNILSK